jgi:hypothetical protein
MNKSQFRTIILLMLLVLTIFFALGYMAGHVLTQDIVVKDGGTLYIQ